MHLCNPQVFGYPEAKLRNKYKQVGYDATPTSGCGLSDLYHIAHPQSLSV